MDSEALFRTLDIESLRGKYVLIVRAQKGRNFLANMLRAQQVTVHYVTAYKRFKQSFSIKLTLQLKYLIMLDSEWIMTSSEALNHLLNLATKALNKAEITKLKKQKIIVWHLRIAEVAKSLGFSNITVTRGFKNEQFTAALQLNIKDNTLLNVYK